MKKRQQLLWLGYVLLFFQPFSSNAFQTNPKAFIKVNQSHNKRVTEVYLSEDGKKVITEDNHWGVKVWGVYEKHLLKTMYRKPDVTHYGYKTSGDGRYYLINKDKNGTNLYDLMSGKKLYGLDESATKLGDFSKNPQSNQVAIGNSQGLRYWDLATGQEIELESPYEAVNILSFSPTGQLLATANYDYQQVNIWNLNQRKIITTIKSKEFFSALSFDSKGKYLCGLQFLDSQITCWNTLSGKPAFTLDNQKPVLAAQYNPKKPQIASCDGEYFKIWDTQSKKVIFQEKDDAFLLSYSKTGDKIVTYGQTNIKIRNAQTGSVITIIPLIATQETSYYNVELDTKQGLLICYYGLAETSKVSAWNTQTGELIYDLNKTAWVGNMTDGKTFLVKQEEYELLDKATGKLLKTIYNRYKFLNASSPIIDFELIVRNQLLVGFDNYNYKLLDIYADTLVKEWVTKPLEDLRNTRLSQGKKYCLTTKDPYGNKHLMIWKTADWQLHDSIQTPKTHSFWITSPKDKYLLMFTIDSLSQHVLSAWDLAKKEKVYSQSHPLSVSRDWEEKKITFSPNDKIMVMAHEQQLNFFEVRTGKHLYTQRPPLEGIESLIGWVNDQKLLLLDKGGVIRVWNPKTRKILGSLYIDTSSGSWIVTTPDNHYEANKAGIKRMFLMIGNKAYSLPHSKSKRVKNLWHKLLKK